jgi:hypothetical protein
LNNYGSETETQDEISVAELKLLGPDFVFGVISMVDGERDPRNLLQLFGMLPQFIRMFPLGHLTEEMFDVVSCYFPVDFYSVSIKASPLCALILQNWLSCNQLLVLTRTVISRGIFTCTNFSLNVALSTS